MFIQRDPGQRDLGQLVHLITNTDDLAMTTIFSQMKDEVYQVFTVFSMMARQTLGITLHIQSPSFSLFSDHLVLPQPFVEEDGHS